MKGELKDGLGGRSAIAWNLMKGELKGLGPGPSHRRQVESHEGRIESERTSRLPRSLCGKNLMKGELKALLPSWMSAIWHERISRREN